MSDNPSTVPQDGGSATAAPEPAATDAEALAPADTGAATEQPEHKPAGDEADPAAKRIARLTARFSQTARERDELAARIAQLEAAQTAGTPDGDRAAEIRAEAQRIVAAERTQERIAAFHEAGREAYPDWQDRCASLVAMGADAQMSQLLIEMKDGPKVAAALHDDPDELERIAKLSTPTARAIALGVYAGRLETVGNGSHGPAGSGGVLPSGRAVSRAPAPIRPVQGRAAPVFNEYTATTEQLTEYYAKQARIARGLPG